MEFTCDGMVRWAFGFANPNELVSSTSGGVTTCYEYDAAGRLVKEGDKTYRYGYLDKVMSVADGALPEAEMVGDGLHRHVMAEFDDRPLELAGDTGGRRGRERGMLAPDVPAAQAIILRDGDA